MKGNHTKTTKHLRGCRFTAVWIAGLAAVAYLPCSSLAAGEPQRVTAELPAIGKATMAVKIWSAYDAFVRGKLLGDVRLVFNYRDGAGAGVVSHDALTQAIRNLDKEAVKRIVAGGTSPNRRSRSLSGTMAWDRATGRVTGRRLSSLVCWWTLAQIRISTCSTATRPCTWLPESTASAELSLFPSIFWARSWIAGPTGISRTMMGKHPGTACART